MEKAIGRKIQNVGSKYSDNQDFILFDVYINDNWQTRESVEDIAKYFNIKAVPILLYGNIGQAVEYIKSKPLSKIAKQKLIIEGVVGRTLKELRDRQGNRVIVKIKVRDFDT